MVDSPALARGIFASYFVLILSLFGIILRSLWRRVNALGTIPPTAAMFAALAVGSFYHTWFYMIKFLQWSFHEFETRHTGVHSTLDRVTRWLMGTDLFEQAWRRVCEGPVNWWWSEQLCILTVGVWTAFLYVQGSRLRIPCIWAYMLLGQVVAISVASNLFFAAVILCKDATPGRSSKSPTGTKTRVPPGVCVPILLSHLTILLSPTVARPDSRWFLPNLLTMHLLIVLPLLTTPPANQTRSDESGISLGTFYLLLASLALVPRAQTYLSIPLSELSVSNLLTTLYSHPAQSSIGFDVVWTTGSFAVYCALVGGPVLGLVALVSPGLALYLDGTGGSG